MSQKVLQWVDRDGQEYYQELLGIFKDLKSSDVWETLQYHWKLYQKKHYEWGDNEDDDLRVPEEECAASYEDDWKIDMPDGTLTCWTGFLRRFWGIFVMWKGVCVLTHSPVVKVFAVMGYQPTG